MKITWLGHSAFRVETTKSVLLIDPFLTGNPGAADIFVKDAIKGATHIALTHGHGDHVGDTIQLADESGAKVIANFDLCMWLEKKASRLSIRAIQAARFFRTGFLSHSSMRCIRRHKSLMTVFPIHSAMPTD